MVLKYIGCVVVTILSFNTSFAKDITFNIRDSGKFYTCVDIETELKVGEQFRVHLSHGNFYIHNVARCLKSQNYNKNVETTFNTARYSDDNITVTVTGVWNYQCIFYFYPCEYFVLNKCTYHWYGRRYEDNGIACSSNVLVKAVVIPNGYLTANAVNFSTNGKEYTYTYHDGDAGNFSCHNITGISSKLSYTSKGQETLTNSIWNNSVSLSTVLKAADNGSTLECIITGDNTEQVIKLRLFLIDTRGWPWFIILTAIVMTLTLACIFFVGLYTSYTYEKKKRLKNNSSSVLYQNTSAHQRPTTHSQRDDTYAEPYSIITKAPMLTTEPENTLEDHTYLNSQQLINELAHGSEQKSKPANPLVVYASVQKSKPANPIDRSEPSYAEIDKIEPNYSLVDRSEPSYAAVHKSEPIFASLQNRELKFASVNTSVQNLVDIPLFIENPTYANQQLIDNKNIIVNLKDTQTHLSDKNPSSVGKNVRVPVSSHSEAPKRKKKLKSNDLNYADLCLENNGRDFVAAKKPTYGDIKR